MNARQFIATIGLSLIVSYSYRLIEELISRRRHPWQFGVKAKSKRELVELLREGARWLGENK